MNLYEDERKKGERLEGNNVKNQSSPEAELDTNTELPLTQSAPVNLSLSCFAADICRIIAAHRLTEAN